MTSEKQPSHDERSYGNKSTQPRANLARTLSLAGVTHESHGVVQMGNHTLSLSKGYTSYHDECISLLL